MILPTPISKRTYKLFPYATLFRSRREQGRQGRRRLPRGRTRRDAGQALRFVRREQRRQHQQDRMGPAWRRPSGEARRMEGKACGRDPCGGRCRKGQAPRDARRSEEHTSELQSLMRISYADFCLKKTTLMNMLSHTDLNKREFSDMN